MRVVEQHIKLVLILLKTFLGGGWLYIASLHLNTSWMEKKDLCFFIIFLNVWYCPTFLCVVEDWKIFLFYLSDILIKATGKYFSFILKIFLFYLSDILIKPLIKEDEGPRESSNRKYEKGICSPTFPSFTKYKIYSWYFFLSLDDKNYFPFIQFP